MNNEDIQNVDQEFINKSFAGKKIIDLGEVMIENETDRELFYKYLEALKEGDTTYKPQGLKIKKAS